MLRLPLHHTTLNSIPISHQQVGARITYHLLFPPSFSFQVDPTITIPSLLYERAGVVYNTAAVYSGLAAMENRDETEGIKRALTYLQASLSVILFNLVQDLRLIRHAS